MHRLSSRPLIHCNLATGMSGARQRRLRGFSHCSAGPAGPRDRKKVPYSPSPCGLSLSGTRRAAMARAPGAKSRSPARRGSDSVESAPREKGLPLRHGSCYNKLRALKRGCSQLQPGILDSQLRVSGINALPFNPPLRPEHGRTPLTLFLRAARPLEAPIPALEFEDCFR